MSKLRTSASTAITTVLILGSVSAIIASLMLFQSTDNAISAKVLREGEKAAYAAEACAEIALEKLRVSTSYTGNEQISLSASQNCDIGTITTSLGSYTIPVSATNGESTKRLQIVVDSIGSNIIIESWKEQ